MQLTGSLCSLSCRNDIRGAIAAATDSLDTLERDSMLSRLEKQMVDIERAEKRNKQQILEQKRFQKKMMREAVGRLYQDKREVTSSSPTKCAEAAATGPSSARAFRGWPRFGFPAWALQLGAVIGAFLTRLLHRQQEKIKDV